MLTLSGLSKVYAGGAAALANVSLTVAGGEIAAIVGGSGCGKTTLLRHLSDRMTQAGLRVAWVFQEDRLIPWLDAWENVALAGAGREDALSLLTALGLGDAAIKRPGELSGGMKRRVAIARALAFQGDALILDEPFKGLDHTAKENAAQLLIRLGPPLCLLVTHNREEAALLSDEVWMVDGPPLRLVRRQ